MLKPRNIKEAIDFILFSNQGYPQKLLKLDKYKPNIQAMIFCLLFNLHCSLNILLIVLLLFEQVYLGPRPTYCNSILITKS